LSLPQKSLKALLELAASGAVGVALLLGAAPAATAAQEPSDQSQDTAQKRRVAERLAVIRDAVSEVEKTEGADPLRAQRLAWTNWGNGGGRPWGNAGWGRPWGNSGYGYPWNNWKNWRNGWNNWRNGWGNYR